MDDDIERDPESEASIEERREHRRELNRGYKRAMEVADDSGYDDVLTPTENPAKTEARPLWEAIADKAGTIRMRSKNRFDPLAATLGSVTIRGHYWTPGTCGDVLRDLDGREVVRLYLYFDLSPVPEVRIADQLDYTPLQEELSLSDTVSQSTLNRLPEKMPQRKRQYYANQAETLVRQWQDTPHEAWVREPTPDTISPDGEGIPPVQVLVRELRSDTFPYIRLKRDDSVEVSKDAALRVLVAAANGGEFVNDAAKNLDLKQFYDGDEVPTGQTLLYHIRKSSRGEITRMFIEANEPLFELADEFGYFDESAEVAIDITDWPFYGDKDADSFVRGTKPSRNHSRAWKYITLSLVGTDTPLTLLVLPVKKKTNAPYYVRRLLRLAEQYVNIKRVYLDAGTEFYSEDAISTVDEFDVELVMQGIKQGADIKRFLHGMAHLDMGTNQMPYGVGNLDEEEYTALGQKSWKKSSRRKSEAENPWDDYVYYYTNADMDQYSVEDLAAGYRKRWGIETGYRVLKEEFLAKSASPDATVRTFYFNFAAHLYNLWTAANIRRAEAVGHSLADGKQFTAGRFMQAIEDDPYDLKIPDEPSESRDVFDSLFL